MAREVIDIIIQERGGVRVERVIERIGNRADRSQRQVSLLRSALGSLATGFALREVLRSLDTYQRLDNQLRIVTGSTQELVATQSALFDVAQRSRAPLEQTVNLYSRLQQASSDLGVSQAETIAFTEDVGRALAIQGTTAAGARGALIQLSQAMGEGIIRAQEFNSLVENARPLLLAAARGIDEAGGSVNRLRQLVINGELSSREFFDAIREQSGFLEEAFGRTTATIGQALTRLNNAWIQFIGTSAAGQAILSAVVEVLGFLTNNFENLASVVVIAGVAYATYWGASVLTASVVAIRSAVAAQVALSISLGATAGALTTLRAGLIIATTQVRVFTAAIAANPLGLLAVAITGIVSALFLLRNEMVTFGNQTASVGSIVAVIFTEIKRLAVTLFDVFSGVAQAVGGAVSNAFNSVVGFFLGITLRGKDLGNFLIAVFKSTIDAIVTEFRVLLAVAVGVFQGIAAAGRGVFDGLGAAITGDFEAAGEAFGAVFSGETFDFQAASDAARAGAQTIARNFERDFLGEIGAIIGDGVTSIIGQIVDDAAARDALLAAAGAEGIDLSQLTTQLIDVGGAAGGAAGELAGVAKQLEEITDGSIATQMQELADRQVALGIAFQTGRIGLHEYLLEQNALRLEATELSFELQNVGQAIRDANVAILELSVSAGTATFADSFLLQLARMTEGVTNFRTQAGTVFGEFFESFTTGFANSIGRAIVQSENLGDALRQVASQALTQLLSGLIKLGLQYVINAAIGKAVGAAATAASTAQAATVAAAWAPAAALASLASFGGNAVPANAAIIGTLASTKSLAAVGSFADGGRVSAPGGPRDDRGIAAVSNGEFIMNARSTAQNLPLLQAMNRGVDIMSRLPRFQDGGVFGAVSTPPRIMVQRADAESRRAGAQGERPVNIQVVNEASNVRIRTEQLSADEIRIIAEEVVDERTDSVVGDAIQNPSSQTSRALESSTSTERTF